MATPPDPYMLKVVETATKTTIEIVHEDIKAGVKGLINIIQERGKEQAIQNAHKFEKAFESDISARMISIGVSPNSQERITGNLNDPDFAYIVRQATIASARTANEEKHKLLARAVTERLFAKPEGLVALASSLACEIIPNLTTQQLSFLGLLTMTTSIRPYLQQEILEGTAEIQQHTYLAWLYVNLRIFQPYPKMRPIDYSHLQSMSCILVSQVIYKDWRKLLKPTNLPKFSWPEHFLEKEEFMLQLKEINGLLGYTVTTTGAIIGTHVYDIKSNSGPTIFTWDDPEAE